MPAARLARLVRSRCLAALALLVLIGALGVPAAADPDDRLDSLQRRRAQVRAEIEDLAKRGNRLGSAVRTLDRDRTKAEEQLGMASAKLAVLDQRIAAVTRQLAEAQQELSVVTDELTRLESRLLARTNLFEERAVATYKAGPTAYVSSILSAETFAEVLDRYAYYQSALETDSELIAEIQFLRDETDARRDRIEEKRNEISQAKLALDNDRREADAARREREQAVSEVKRSLGQKQALLAGVRGREAGLRTIEDQLERESQQIQALLSAQAARATTAGGSVPARVSRPGGRLAWPASGPVTSGFGYRRHPIFGDTRKHNGIDIGAPYGASVVAADTGVVVFVGTMSGYGNVVAIDHGGGLATTYNHLSAFYVGRGQRVGRGTRVAAVGCSGYCTGPHLHFEVRINGTPVDPIPYLT